MKLKLPFVILLFLLYLIVLYLLVQGIRCFFALKNGKERLTQYNAKTLTLSYGDITYVGQGEGEVILSVHGIFGGYDQVFDTCRDYLSEYRIIAPSRFGYLGNEVKGEGTPKEQAEAFNELLDALSLDKVYFLSTSAGGSVAIRFCS